MSNMFLGWEVRFEISSLKTSMKKQIFAVTSTFKALFDPFKVQVGQF